MENYQEKRKFRRAIFTLEDNVVGLLSLARKPGKIITGYVLNLSMGGIYFTIDATKTIIPEIGDKIVLMQIKAPRSLGFLVNIDAQAKWVLNPTMLKYIGVGCEFINIPELSRKQLGDFVDSWPR
jgi:hypothetical protein